MGISRERSNRKQGFMNISIIGSGYVGLVTGAALAELGNRVICVDSDPKKIASLKKGKVPIYEPGLKELIAGNFKKKRLKFTSSIKEAVDGSEIIFISVWTPTLKTGEADLSAVENVARNIALNMRDYRLIVDKSTVPVETGLRVKGVIETYIKNKVDFDIASNPEFLKEGSAIRDFMHPDRIVIGVESKRAAALLTRLYKPLNAPMVVTDIKSAELIKHASNSFLATKISFINAVARICDLVGADVTEVARGMGLDKRIGSSFLNAGLGYGGSCFPKDLNAFIGISKKLGYDFHLLKSVKNINQEQKEFVLRKVKDSLWILKDKTIAVLGLSFKPDTDDIRNAPALELIGGLRSEGAKVQAYDPQAMEKAEKILKSITFCRDAYEACRNADCVILATDWAEFKSLNFKKIKRLVKRPLIIDGRNIYDPDALKKSGFTYVGIGRRSHE